MEFFLTLYVAIVAAIIAKIMSESVATAISKPSSSIPDDEGSMIDDDGTPGSISSVCLWCGSITCLGGVCSNIGYDDHLNHHSITSCFDDSNNMSSFSRDD